MKTREEIFDIYVTQFSSYKTIMSINNPLFCPNDQSIMESIMQTEELFSKYLNEIVLDEAEKDLVVKKIKSVFSIYQEEGDALLGDYQHDYKWYENYLNEGNDEYYWSRYKNYLTAQKHFPPEVIRVLENDTMKNIMSYIGNPNDENDFSVRGLVVGDVQSGKTSNYIGLVTKAADAGYRVIFVLTGTIESLRKQTQIRVEEGFVGYDVAMATDVGVGRGDKTPKSFTSRTKDFVADDDQNTNIKISNNPCEPMIFVVKKNASVLNKLYTSLKNINTTKQYQKIKVPMLLIDDEADNASINTHKPEDDPTRINKYIRNILSLFSKNSYVGFTATPFANVFICYNSEDEMLKDDLFPRDFIYSLKAPSNYCGSKKYFTESNNNICLINDGDEGLFPMKHKKEWSGDRLFASLYEAINTFLISNAIRDLRERNTNINTHRSMLINMTRFTKVQLVIKRIVEDYYISVRNAVKQTHRLDPEYALTNPIIRSLKDTFDKEYSSIISNGSIIEWEVVRQNLFQAIKDIDIVVVNSSKQSAKLNYEDHKETGLRVIAIGGLALSRGLTLEGLCVSYFYRNTSTFDVLMQMGRWFGYRDGYADLCKIFITKETESYYKYICESIEDLRSDIEKMGLQNKKPEDYGIRVRNNSIDLGITAANKSRNTKVMIYRKSFYGNVFETPHLHRNLDIIENNITVTNEFLNKISIIQKDSSVAHPYFRNIPKEDVVLLLSKLCIHKASESYFDPKQILKFLKRSDSELDCFDVLIMGGKESSCRFIYPKLNIDISMVSRTYDVPDYDPTVIRISRQRARLGGPADTKNGLSKDQIPSGAKKSQDYMINGRNPLLIIYYINPDNSELTNVELHTGVSSKSEDSKVRYELLTRRYNFLIGFALCFPNKPGAVSESIMYTVNKTVNYFEKDHEEGDDCNE